MTNRTIRAKDVMSRVGRAPGRSPDRFVCLVAGGPGSGKTTYCRQILDHLALRGTYGPIAIMDRMGEHSRALEHLIGDIEEQLDLVNAEDSAVLKKTAAEGVAAGAKARRSDGVIVRNRAEYDFLRSLIPGDHPVRVVWRCGPNPEDYAEAVAATLRAGDGVLYLAEAPDWFTSWERDWPIQKIPGYDFGLGTLLTQGRAHIPSETGRRCGVSLLLDSQDLAIVHWKIRKFSTHVVVSQMEGGESYRTLEREFGRGDGAARAAVERLKKYEWASIRPIDGTPLKIAPMRK